MGFNNGNSSFGFGGGSSGGGGGGGISFVTTCNNATFSLYGNGTAGSPLNGCTILSACPNNALSVCSDGLFATDNNSAVVILGSGSFSSVRCGVNNTASGCFSGAISGQCNTSSGFGSFVGSGFKILSQGDYSFIGNGICNNLCNSVSGCLALGSVIVGGVGNNTTGGFFDPSLCTFSGVTVCNAGAYSFIGGGFQNRASNNSAVVISGFTNTASGCCSFIGTGSSNSATSVHAFVGNGQSNSSSGCRSFIGSGVNHTASGLVSVLVGGNQNTVSSYGGAILGGRCNIVAGGFSSIVGGANNTICSSNGASFIGGGSCNIVSGVNSVIVGGTCNRQLFGGFGTFIGGGCLNQIQAYASFVGTGICNAICNGTPEFGAYSSIVSGLGNNTTGGTWDTASNTFTVAPTPVIEVGCYSFIGSGFQNRTLGNGSAISGGRLNLATGSFSIIGGGVCNNICNNVGTNIDCFRCLSLASVIVGGVGNNTTGGSWDIATCTFTVAPTVCNSGQYTFIGGGFQNVATGNRSAILGGQLNNTCGFADAQIIGSCICASQVCTTFVNCLSASNIPSGCAVCSTTNNVLVGFTTPNYNIGFFTQTANSTPISGTTTETTLINGGVGSLTVPSNTFKVGDSFVAIMGGVINTDNNQTIRIRVKAGSVILADSGVQSITNIVNDVFTLNINFTIRQIGATTVASIVTLGTFVYHKTSNTNVSSFAFNTVNSTTFDTTINNTLDITVEWGSASVVNSIFSDIFTLNKTY